MCAVAENHNSSNSQPTLKTAPRIAASKNIEETRGGTRIRFAMALSSLSVAIKRRRVFSKTNHKASVPNNCTLALGITSLDSGICNTTHECSEREAEKRTGGRGRVHHFRFQHWQAGSSELFAPVLFALGAPHRVRDFGLAGQDRFDVLAGRLGAAFRCYAKSGLLDFQFPKAVVRRTQAKASRHSLDIK